MMTPTTLQRELEINRAIDDRLNELLSQMKKLLDDSRIWDSKMELNQIQNLLAVAHETNSVEVVKNFILYQIGRDGRADSWRRRVGTGPAFGEQIVAELDRLRGVAAGIVPQGGLNEAESQVEVDRAWMKLTRLYLGYLRRYFYYKKRS